MIWASVVFAASLDEVSAALTTCRTGTIESVPALDRAAIQRLAAGEIVKIVHRNADPNAPSSAVGMAVLPGTLQALWLAVQDPHADVDTSLTEFITEQKTPDHALWYGYLDLPRPISDRHWVVESTNNHELAVATGNRCWEHNWRLVENGLDGVRPLFERAEARGITPEQFASAVYTPVNHGHWLLAPLPGGTHTLVSYQATSVIGGNIPNWLVLKLAMGRLDAVVGSAATRARDWVPRHYVAGHAAVMGGDGKELPLLQPKKD